MDKKFLQFAVMRIQKKDKNKKYKRKLFKQLYFRFQVVRLDQKCRASTHDSQPQTLKSIANTSIHQFDQTHVANHKEHWYKLDFWLKWETMQMLQPTMNIRTRDNHYNTG